MSDLLNEQEFTQQLADQIIPMGIETRIPEALVVELHYGESEPVLAIPLKAVYDEYRQDPTRLSSLFAPYVREIGWTVQEPRFSAREIFEKTVPIMKDTLAEPIPQDGDKVIVDGKEIVLRLKKGPVLYQEMIARPAERLVVQFMLETDDSLTELHKGDILTCFPQEGQIANIAIQNLARKAVESGLTSKIYNVENLRTGFHLIGLRDASLSEYVASLINVADILKALQDNLEAPAGMLVSIPARDKMFISRDLTDDALCELWFLGRHTREQSASPLSSLIWTVNGGEIAGVRTVNLTQEK